MSGITLVVEDASWRRVRGLQARLKQAAQAAARAVKLKGGVTILLADDRRLNDLNLDFRGKDKPTNVLSFPGSGDYAGDIAIAHGVTRAEAEAEGGEDALREGCLVFWLEFPCRAGNVDDDFDAGPVPPFPPKLTQTNSHRY